MDVPVANQIRECAILLAYARQTKATAEGDLVYWSGHTTDSAQRARSEMIRSRDVIADCDAAIVALELSREAATSGLDIAESLRSVRKALDRLVNWHVLHHSNPSRRVRVRAHSTVSVR